MAAQPRAGRPCRRDSGAGVEGQALAGKGSLRGSEAWPLGRAERRSGEHRRCRGGLAAGGGGAGPRRRLSSAPLCLGLLPSSPVPYTLHPLLPLPPAASCFTSPPLGPQEPAAHGEDGGGSTGSSGCGIQYGGSESGRAAWRSAAPASAPPGDWTAWPGGRAETIERARARASPPGGSAPLARGRRGLGPPPPAPGPRGSERCSPVERAWRPLQSVARGEQPHKRPHRATSLGKNFVHAFVVSMRIGPFTGAAGFSCSPELYRKVAYRLTDENESSRSFIYLVTVCPSILIASGGNIRNKLRIRVGAGGWGEKHACSLKAAPAGNACCIKSRVD